VSCEEIVASEEIASKRRNLLEPQMDLPSFEENTGLSFNRAGKKLSSFERMFWQHAGKNLKIVEKIDFSREKTDIGTIWLPLELGGMYLADGPYVKMCLMDYNVYRNAPWDLPMYKFIFTKQCLTKTAVEEDRTLIVKLSSIMDQIKDAPRLKIGGFIFHDTRCGSTLVANQIAVLPQNRVFSESRPPTQCLRAYLKNQMLDPRKPDLMMTREMFEECINGVMALFSRSRENETQQQIFIKFQNSRFAPQLTEIFNDVPWVYLFRDPVEVMVSNIGRGETGGPCVREGLAAAQKLPDDQKEWLIRAKSMKSGDRGADHELMEKLSMICASWLLEMDEAARTAYQSNPSKGVFIDYNRLPNAVPDFLYTKHFKVDLSVAENWQEIMESATNHYSKKSKKDISKPDIELKHKNAPPEVVKAANETLYPSYKELSERVPESLPIVITQ